MEQNMCCKKAAGNQDTGFLKIIALLCMLLDHTGVIFFSQITEFRIIGRIAFPLYAWCLVVGSCKTGNIFRYAFRLFFMGLISQPLYMLSLNHQAYELNIMFTLFLSLLAIIAIQKKQNGSHIWGPAVILLLSLFLKVDYGWKGVLFPILLYLAKDKKESLFAVIFSYCLFWGGESRTVSSIFSVPLPNKISFLAYSSSFIKSISKLQFFAVLALPFILADRKKLTRVPKWISYSAYPGHLALLILLRLIFKV